MRRRPCSALGLLALGLLLGCSSDHLVPIEEEIHEAFQQLPGDGGVDVLFVIDDSCSMEDEQALLGSAFDSFIAAFLATGADYHLGVTTTDVETRMGQLFGSAPIISPDTEDPATAFADNVNVGIDGSADEMGLLASMQALSTSMTYPANSFFYREEARLVLVYVSDENDQSPGEVRSDYLEFFLELKDDDPSLVMAAAIVGIDPQTGEAANCTKPGDGAMEGAEDGRRYKRLVDSTLGGVSGSICQADFTEVVGAIGTAAASLVASFPLEAEPKPDTVQVRLFVPGTAEFFGDGFSVPSDGLDGNWPWRVEADDDGQWWLLFTDPPPEGTRVEVNYVRKGVSSAPE